MNLLEGQMETIETTLYGLKAETTTLCQEIKELTRVLGGRARNLDRNSEESQDFVNENRRGRREGSDEEVEYDRGEALPSWVKRVDLPTYEGLNPLG